MKSYILISLLCVLFFTFNLYIYPIRYISMYVYYPVVNKRIWNWVIMHSCLHHLLSWIFWFFSRYFFLCLHSDASSFLLFNVAIFGLHIMIYFSFKHRWQALLEGEYGLALVITFHVILYWTSLFLRDHIYLLRAVLDLSLFLNDCVCWLYLSLKVFEVSPVYVSLELLSSRVTVAWYITDLVRHLLFCSYTYFVDFPWFHLFLKYGCCG